MIHNLMKVVFPVIVQASLLTRKSHDDVHLLRLTEPAKSLQAPRLHKSKVGWESWGQLSNEKKNSVGCFFLVDYTTQLYGDYSKPLSLLNKQYSGK